ncbi:protein phosphatase 2C domain-containing protein [soil metagenome]
MRLVVAAETDVGRVREGNEDSYLVDEPLFVVADGMGGHRAGDVASRTAIDAVERELVGRRPRPEELAAALQDANASILAKARADSSLAGMGTTCTLLYVEDGHAHIAHIGDSRAYLLRADRLEQLTEDHTLVERMVREGRISREDAEHHPQRNVITRALGLDESIDVDLMALDLQAGDRFLLCSDGLPSMLDEGRIREVLAEADDLRTAAEELVELANDAGGEDNITVVLVEIGDEAGAPASSADEVLRDDERPLHESTDPSLPAARDEREQDSAPRSNEVATSRRRPGLALLVTLLVVVLLLGGGYAGVRYALTHSWYVGAGSDGFVTVFRGVPEKVAGVSLAEPMKQTSVALSDLPDFLAGNVKEGIKVDSVSEAERRVEDLRARAREFSQAQREPDKKAKAPDQTQGSNQKG